MGRLRRSLRLFAASSRAGAFRPRFPPSAGVAGHRLQEKIVLAWVVVHGFATLMLDNVLFASQAGAAAGGTQALLRRLLQMCQPGFALRDAPGG